MLKAQCRGPPPPGGGNAHRLQKLRAGIHPRTGEDYGRPQPIEVALDTYSVILGDGDAAEEPRQVNLPGASLGTRSLLWPRFSDDVTRQVQA